MAESNSSLDANCKTTKEGMKFSIAEPHDLSPKAGYIYPEMEVRKKLTKFPV
ncbi:MAG: hypothetical protein ACTSXA_11325 [Candidatus Heimdallarchaeota archaeon]